MIGLISYDQISIKIFLLNSKQIFWLHAEKSIAQEFSGIDKVEINDN